MITTHGNVVAVWQIGQDVPEQPVLIARYDGTLALEQEDRTINILHESIDELIAALRAVQSKPRSAEIIFTEDITRELKRATRRIAR